MTESRKNSMYGPIAMQKRRLAQVETLIEQYSRLITETGDQDRFGTALERAIQQKLRIQTWLEIHEKSRDPSNPAASLQAALATLIS